jgi:hypothetical protein
MTLITGYDIVAIDPSCPGIHVFLPFKKQDVDGRNKSGHDE